MVGNTLNNDNSTTPDIQPNENSKELVSSLTSPTWKTIFIEVAVRAILEVHFEYCIWEIGQKKLESHNISKLYSGNGIHMALEDVVTNSISQWFLKLGFFKLQTIDDEGRSYIIEREFQIKKKDGQGNNYYEIDIVLKRIQPENSDKSLTLPVLIEAKRFQRLKMNLANDVWKLTDPQVGEIQKDILKLYEISIKCISSGISVFGEKPFHNAYYNLLVWGKSGNGINIDTNVVEHIKGMFDERYQTVINTVNSIYRKINVNSFQESPSAEFIWVALIELDFKTWIETEIRPVNEVFEGIMDI